MNANRITENVAGLFPCGKRSEKSAEKVGTHVASDTDPNMRKGWLTFWTIALWLVGGITILIPVYLVVVNSFKSKTEAALMNFSLPTKWLFGNYAEMIADGGILTGLKNSVIITVTCVAVIVLFSSQLAFVLQRRKSRLSSALSKIMLLGIIIPVQIIPSVLFSKMLHLTPYVSAIFVLIVANFSIAVFLYTGFLKSIPAELDESAILDGASPLILFFRIIFPLLRPVTMTVIIISFLAIWNDFGNTIYFLNSSANYTITLTIYNFFGDNNSSWQLVFANVVFASLPVVIVFLTLQRNIIAGMTAGSVKG